MFVTECERLKVCIDLYSVSCTTSSQRNVRPHIILYYGRNVDFDQTCWQRMSITLHACKLDYLKCKF